MSRAAKIAYGLSGLIVVGLVALAIAPIVKSAASPPGASARDGELYRSLAHMVESAQEDLWQFREDLAHDPEATIPEIWFVSDARPIYGDPSFAVGGGTYTLLGASTTSEGSTLTLATSGSTESGGGWFYSHKRAAVCFELFFPAEEAAIHTSSSDCTDGNGHGLADVPAFERHGAPVSIDELTLRRTVTDEDFQPLPCQCSSGGSCECPGG